MRFGLVINFSFTSPPFKRYRATHVIYIKILIYYIFTDSFKDNGVQEMVLR